MFAAVTWVLLWSCQSALVFPMALFCVTRLISPSPCKISVSHAVSCVSQLTISYSVLCRSLSCFKKTFSLSLFFPSLSIYWADPYFRFVEKRVWVDQRASLSRSQVFQSFNQQFKVDRNETSRHNNTSCSVITSRNLVPKKDMWNEMIDMGTISLFWSVQMGRCSHVVCDWAQFLIENDGISP